VGALEGKVLAVLCRGTDADRALCVEAAEAGADIALATVAPDDEFRVASIANEVWSIGTRQFVVAMDATEPTAMAAFAARVMDELGSCDIAVASTCVRSEAPFAELSADEWGPVLTANLTVPYLFVEALSKEMGRQGRGVIGIVSEERKGADAAEKAARAALASLVEDASAALESEGFVLRLIDGEPVDALKLLG
jgi:NAD(P)-dependent dehydrogenase (short-subunit alcohol dehydrogenase family)